MFQRALNTLYMAVDKASDLAWAARGESELIANPTNRRTRSKLSERDKEDDSKWLKDFNGSVGYGEITKVSYKTANHLQGAMTNYFTLC
jgi:hypothetical protein